MPWYALISSFESEMKTLAITLVGSFPPTFRHGLFFKKAKSQNK